MTTSITSIASSTGATASGLRGLNHRPGAAATPPAGATPSERESFVRSERPLRSAGAAGVSATLATLGLLLAGAGAAQAQVQMQPAAQPSADLQSLREASVVQGIRLEFVAPGPVAGGRLIEGEDALRLLESGNRVVINEVTAESGVERGDSLESNLIRREARLESLQDLQSFSRYFRGDAPQNATESAAAQLKKYVYQQAGPTTSRLEVPGQSPARNGLSPWSAARSLAAGESVDVRAFSANEAETEGRERPETIRSLDRLEDVDDLVRFDMQPGCSLTDSLARPSAAPGASPRAPHALCLF